MINGISAEFQKTRRRKVWLIVAALICVQIAWILWSFRHISAQEMQQGWMIVLYQFALLNAIFMPVIAAVVASRLSDVEHKGKTLKLLETAIPAGKLFDAKFACGAVYMLVVVVFQVLILISAGMLLGFEGAIPFEKLALYLLFTTCVNITILLFQQVLSLTFVNQMISLSVGLIGSFAGLFIMFFPQNLERFILWGYYGVLMLVGMNWDPATRISDYYWVPMDWQGFITLAIMFCVIFIVGRFIFVRKEM